MEDEKNIILPAGAEDAAKDFEENNAMQSYWLEGELVIESTPLRAAFIAGIKWLLEQSQVVDACMLENYDKRRKNET